MQEHVGLLIAAARRRIKLAVVARAAAHQLTPQQFWFLIAVREHPGASQAELAAWVRADAPTASRVLASLIRRKLVRVSEDAADRRRMLVSLTAAGDRLARELARTADEVRDVIVDGMSPSEIAVLRRGLQRVIANLESHGERGAGPVGAGDES